MTPTHWTNEFLDSMREVTDPLADDAVMDLFQENDIEAVNKLLHDLVTNDEMVPSQLPERIQKYLQESSEFPAWANAEKIKLAEDLFSREGVLICSALFFSSLPTCYACAKGVQVLQLTARLETNPTRRIAETGQMIIDVMMTGGLAPNGFGIRDAQKVRLMHASIRHLALNHPRWQALWNPAWGKPINQEDMAGTLLSFSRLPLNALAKLGVSVTAEEREAYNHTWNVVGHLMGLRPDMQPATSDLAQQLGDIIGQRNYGDCPAGREMTAALLNVMQSHMPLRLLKGLPRTMIRYLAGDVVANTLGLPADDWTEKLIRWIRALIAFVLDEEHNSRLFAYFVRKFSNHYLETVPTIERGGVRAPFNIPEELTKRWKLIMSSTPSK